MLCLIKKITSLTYEKISIAIKIYVEITNVLPIIFVKITIPMQIYIGDSVWLQHKEALTGM